MGEIEGVLFGLLLPIGLAVLLAVLDKLEEIAVSPDERSAKVLALLEEGSPETVEVEISRLFQNVPGFAPRRV